MSTIHTIYSISTRIHFPTRLAMWLKLTDLNSHGTNPNQKWSKSENDQNGRNRKWTKTSPIRKGPKWEKSEMDQNGPNQKWTKMAKIGNDPNQKWTKTFQIRNGPKRPKSERDQMVKIINGLKRPKSEMYQNSPFLKWTKIALKMTIIVLIFSKISNYPRVRSEYSHFGWNSNEALLFIDRFRMFLFKVLWKLILNSRFGHN